MVRAISAKTLLASVRQPDPWFGLKYNMNLYRGCQHGCIYCDTRSECYGIDDLDDVAVKINALQLLQQELPRKRVKGVIGYGSMNDCYQPLEAELCLMRGALEIIARHGFPVHILTKSDLVLRDLDLLRQISRTYAAVSLTVTTADDALAGKVEPGAPPPSARLAAIGQLSREGILSGAMLMPVLPFIEDSLENVLGVVHGVHRAGGRYIVAAFGMTLRDRQREYYYGQLDRWFPGLSQRYRQRYGERYSAAANGAHQLESAFRDECSRLGIATRMPLYEPLAAVQHRLL
jgi:DNA repair photolyase